MPLVFIDALGNEGHITADLSIEYDGPEQVEAYVDGIVDGAASTEQAVEDILIGMVRDLDVKEVRRRGNGSSHALTD